MWYLLPKPDWMIVEVSRHGTRTLYLEVEIIIDIAMVTAPRGTKAGHSRPPMQSSKIKLIKDTTANDG